MRTGKDKISGITPPLFSKIHSRLSFFPSFRDLFASHYLFQKNCFNSFYEPCPGRKLPREMVYGSIFKDVLQISGQRAPFRNLYDFHSLLFVSGQRKPT
jgi:hypothetical protein